MAEAGAGEFHPVHHRADEQAPEAVFCDEFAGDFISFVKQATPLGYFNAIDNRLVDGGEVGSVDVTTRAGQRLSVWASGPTPTIRCCGTGRTGLPPTTIFDEKVAKAMHDEFGSSWAIQGYVEIAAIARASRRPAPPTTPRWRRRWRA